jgi:hypothetical protein
MIACIHIWGHHFDYREYDDRLHSYLGNTENMMIIILNTENMMIACIHIWGHHFEYREYDDRLHSYLGTSF